MKTKNLLLCLIPFLTFSCKESQKKPVDSVKEESSNTATIHIEKKAGYIPANGYYTEKYEDGALKIEGLMKNNKREGLWKAWYKNGNLWSQAYYENGLRQGHSTVFYENGKKYYQGEYDNDKQVGKWQFYDPEGNLIKEIKK
jgi:antitoxin component YwqK of YwqJK toxin-antitoxin module